MKPKFKETIPYFFLNNEIQIGEEEGLAGIISDPTGSISYLIKQLDGKRTISEIVEEVQNKFPSINSDEIIEGITVLGNEGYLEDNSIESNLDSYTLERYKANINYFSLFTKFGDNKYKIQERISETPISLLGVGGLGTQVLYHLAALGFHNIKALDFDNIELSNFNRQLLYSEADIGNSKIEMAKKRISQFNPNVNLDITNKKIESPQDVIDHIKGTELVICVADKPTLHIANWVNEGVVKCNLPMVYGGVLNTRGRFFSMIPSDTGCVQCHIDYAKQINDKQEDQLNAMNNMEFTRNNAAISPNVAIVAGTLVNEALKILTKIEKPLSLGKVMEVDFLNLGTNTVSSWIKQPDCPLCGQGVGSGVV
ncbi:ThiF family adenylyltransferase [Shouchella miscanthi]|uniref:ThiF family adenylyltransferase n=1 Tax=Shouchella miscanthi TaxID=2598861 RepID=A0ABU6NN42_9BACI|nr:ThiF family adenylyltransferase [Shouchella miscanthi]